MIGDVVGLGKTMMATALARMFEDDLGYETLIICRKIWSRCGSTYRTEYGLRGMVLPVSQVTEKLPTSSATAWYSLTKAITCATAKIGATKPIAEFIAKLRCQSHPADRDAIRTDQARPLCPIAPVH